METIAEFAVEIPNIWNLTTSRRLVKVRLRRLEIFSFFAGNATLPKETQLIRVQSAENGLLTMPPFAIIAEMCKDR